MQTHTPSIESLAAGLKQLVLETGSFVKNNRPDPAKTKTKGRNDFATAIDLESEKRLVSGLSALLPKSAFLTEEETVTQSTGDYRWIIDPIDGTTNFIYGLPCFAISVALEYKSALLLGAVYDPNREEYFAATENGPATLNDLPIRVGNCEQLSDALIATGFPYQNEDWLKKWLSTFAEVQRSSRGMRRWGAAAIDLAYVACGRFDGYYEYGLKPWDAAAGALLVERAGGAVFNFAGEAARVTETGADRRAVFQQQMIVGNKAVAQALCEKVPMIP